jgi:hypothetical protein
MAWTAPSTWVAGAVLTAAELNEQLRDNMVALSVAPSCLVRRTTSLTGYTATSAIAWNDAAFDTDSMFSAGAPTRITINTTGIYNINFAGVTTSATTMTLTSTAIAVNGTDISGLYITATGNGAFITSSVVASLTAGDYVTVGINYGSGSAFVISGAATTSLAQSRMSATLISKTA